MIVYHLIVDNDIIYIIINYKFEIMNKFYACILILFGLIVSSCSDTISEKDEKGECIYKIHKGLKQGLCVCYYKDGKIRDSVYYEEGLKNGVEMSFDSLGNKVSYIDYRLGKKNGYFTYYYTNGDVYSKGKYYNDSIIGWYYRYYPGYVLEYREEYINIKGETVCNQGEFFNEDGSRDSTINTSFISAIIEKDTFKLLDTFLLKVELKKSYFKDQTNHITKLQIGNFDSNYVLTDTLSLITYISKFYKHNHKVIANKLGQNIIRGVVYDDINSKEDIHYYDFRRKIYFTRKYYVVR